jgi:hypothetical protein
MKKSRENSVTIDTGIPEIDDLITKFGALDNEDPPYVIVGLVRIPTTGWNGGVLAFAKTQLDAYRIRKELIKYGDVDVCRTEHHPDGANYAVDASTEIDKLIKSKFSS